MCGDIWIARNFPHTHRQSKQSWWHMPSCGSAPWTILLILAKWHTWWGVTLACVALALVLLFPLYMKTNLWSLNVAQDSLKCVSLLPQMYNPTPECWDYKQVWTFLEHENSKLNWEIIYPKKDRQHLSDQISLITLIKKLLEDEYPIQEILFNRRMKWIWRYWLESYIRTTHCFISMSSLKFHILKLRKTVPGTMKPRWCPRTLPEMKPRDGGGHYQLTCGGFPVLGCARLKHSTCGRVLCLPMRRLRHIGQLSPSRVLEL